MAGASRMLAGFVPGDQFQGTQGRLRRGFGDLAQGVEGQGPAWGLGGEEEQFVQSLRHHGLEQRE